MSLSRIGLRRICARIVNSLSSSLSNEEKPGVVDFESPQAATAGKTNSEVMRGWFVFNLFNSDHLVDNSLKYYDVSKKALGLAVTEKLLKATVFGQFAGGLDEKECRRSVMRLADSGVTSIWFYSIEKDLHEVADISSESELADKEKEFQETNRKYLKSIKMSAMYNCDRAIRLAAIKLTAIVNPFLVEKLNQMLVISRSVFEQLATEGEFITDRVIPIETLKERLPDLLSNGLEGGTNGVDLIQWSKYFNVAGNINRFKLLSEIAQVSTEQLSLSVLEVKQLESFLEKLDAIGKCAVKYGLRTLIDAEQTYVQVLFDHLAIHYLMPRYNKDQVHIYNTLQGYLKSSMDTLLYSLAASESYGVYCGIKLVRGAYIVQERELAKSKGLPDPIHPTKEATDTSYNSCLSYLLDNTSQKKINTIIASHNMDSVKLAIKKIQELNISHTDGSVAFGQLLGMGDHITYPLAKAGYIVGKVMTYGSLNNVIPFLTRRAQENKSLMVNADREREIYRQELRRRFSK